MDGVEVKSGTAATITCTMTGLDQDKPLTVTWLDGDGNTVDSGTATLEPLASTPGKCYTDNVGVNLRSKARCALPGSSRLRL